MAKKLFGMDVTAEQQLAYVFDQFTDNDDEHPGRIVQMERSLGRIESAMGKRNSDGSGGVDWKRIWYDVVKQMLVVLSSTIVLGVLALLWLGLKIQVAGPGIVR